MNKDTDREPVYSEAVKAGKRIYYLDVKQSKAGDKFISITESKKIIEGGTAEYPRFSFEKHKIFLYKEDFEKFAKALNNVIAIATEENADFQPKQVEHIQYVHENEEPEVANIAAEPTDDEDLSIEF